MITRIADETNENPEILIAKESIMITDHGSVNNVEKRKSPRIKFDSFVVVDMQMHGKTRNLSAGGMCIVIPIFIEKGTMFHINFSLPGDKNVNLFGNVAWIRNDGGSKYECGIEFIDFADHNRKIIREYVEKICH
jgi:hypothetical protein